MMRIRDQLMVDGVGRFMSVCPKVDDIRLPWTYVRGAQISLQVRCKTRDGERSQKQRRRWKSKLTFRSAKAGAKNKARRRKSFPISVDGCNGLRPLRLGIQDTQTVLYSHVYRTGKGLYQNAKFAEIYISQLYLLSEINQKIEWPLRFWIGKIF